MVKIKDVADAAGVSTATVSRVLSNKPHVRPEVKKRVLAVVKKLNYQPNRVAQSLRSSTSRIIALIVADIENPYFQKVSRAVDDTAQELGYNVIVCNTDEDRDKEKKCLDLLRVGNLAGAILALTLEGLEEFDDILALDTPVVVIDRRVGKYDIDNVLIDNVASARHAVTHLLSHGYRRIAGIFGTSTTGRDRRAGFVQAHKDYGLKPEKDLVKYTDAREDDGFRIMTKLLEMHDRPDAVFTSNSLLAAGILIAIRKSGLSVPDDIAFTSFDDTTWATLHDPALTVIEQPTYEIGRTAAELLIKRISDSARPCREVVLKSNLIVRQSCGCR